MLGTLLVAAGSVLIAVGVIGILCRIARRPARKKPVPPEPEEHSRAQ